jgi:hypothetical protein
MDPELYVYHHASPRKNVFGMFIKDRWAHGKAKALIFRKEIKEINVQSCALFYHG